MAFTKVSLWGDTLAKKSNKSLKEAGLAFSEQNKFCFPLEKHFKVCL